MVNEKFNDEVKKYNCETCGKTFNRPFQLRVHISTVHEGVKNHKCEICGKNFSQSSSRDKQT